MSEKSFWENLGRSFGHGVRKVKRVGERLSDEAEGVLDVKEARERLARLHAAIGRKVSDKVLEEPRESPGAIHLDAELRELVDEVRRAREEVARLEAEAERRKRESETTAEESETAAEESETTAEENETAGKRDRGERTGEEPKG